ncbi:MAG TPA: hypothetical protein VFG04_26240 [Planctomycetaceae bacterium]|nr:hypothetical protein [Planctomycetaceae bacterium]
MDAIFQSRQVFWVILFVVIVITGCSDSSNSTVQPPPLIDAGSLKETVVSPVIDATLRPDQNEIYCSTFQIAWDQLKAQLDGHLDLEGDPPLAVALNRTHFDKNGLSPASYFAVVGRVDDGVLDRIRREMGTRFPNANLTFPDPPPSAGLVAYAYLAKSLAFKVAFDRLPHPINFHAGNRTAQIACFGVHDPHRRERQLSELVGQVKILAYASDHDFVLSLKTNSKQDELILAKLPPASTLAATIAAVQTRIDKHPTSPEQSTWAFGSEELAIPLIDFNIRRRYSELISKNLKGQRLSIDVALQDIFFHLDENGARLESQAMAEAKSEASLSKPVRRTFVFDEPFLLMMREVGADAPYFAIWAANPEVLVGR